MSDQRLATLTNFGKTSMCSCVVSKPLQTLPMYFNVTPYLVIYVLLTCGSQSLMWSLQFVTPQFTKPYLVIRDCYPMVDMDYLVIRCVTP